MMNLLPSTNSAKIKKLHVRHYPPGFQIEFTSGNRHSIQLSREILAYLTLDTLYTSAERIVKHETLLQVKSKSKQDKILNLIVKCLTAIINTKQNDTENIELRKYKSGRPLKAHVLPLTNVAFNKRGSLFLTGSYDRTAKIWQVQNILKSQFGGMNGNRPGSATINQNNNAINLGSTNSNGVSPVITPRPNSGNGGNNQNKNEPIILEGHKNVVYTLAFNNPYGNRVATGSFDRTAKIWETSSGKCLQTLRGHSEEVVCLGFNSHSNPNKQLLATGSMDSRCGIWNVMNNNNSDQNNNINNSSNSIVLEHQDVHEPVAWLAGHSGDVIALAWEPHEVGSKLITASFDRTAAVWDVEGKTDSPLYTLIGHREELSSCSIDYTGSLAITGSMDYTSRIWDLLVWEGFYF